MTDRRQFVRAMGGLAAAQLLPAPAFAQPDPFAPLIAAFAKGASVQPGRVKLETPILADNGNSVPLEISVESPMSVADHVEKIVLLSEKNPRPVIATFYLGPRAGRALIVTRVRLAGAQRIMAVAQLSNGTFWSGHVDVIVTSTACWDATD